MPRARLIALAAVAAATFAACGEEGIQLAKSDPNYDGAKSFQQNCSGCHSLAAAGTQGSAEEPNRREIKDGPSFDQRRESEEDVLYAIRNGGFSSGPMPQDIVVGEEAERIAAFVARYSGRQQVGFPEPGNAPPEGATSDGP